MITHAFYISRSKFEAGHPADRDILQTASRNNFTANITGFLFRTPSLYFQVLEGAAGNIERTLSRIRADTRHYDMDEWAPEKAGERQFSDWNMGYAMAEEKELLAAAFQSSKPRPLGEVVTNLRRIAGERFSSDS